MEVESPVRANFSTFNEKRGAGCPHTQRKAINQLGVAGAERLPPLWRKIGSKSLVESIQRRREGAECFTPRKQEQGTVKNSGDNERVQSY